jgi:hypothetical protein
MSTKTVCEKRRKTTNTKSVVVVVVGSNMVVKEEEGGPTGFEVWWAVGLGTRNEGGLCKGARRGALNLVFLTGRRSKRAAKFF